MASARRVATWLTWIVAFVVLVTLAWTTRFATRWPSVYFMTGASMEPTIAAERYFLAWDPPGELQRGDLVLFRYQEKDSSWSVLRRLVGLGGDTVSMKAGALIVNGEEKPWGFRIIEPAAFKSVMARGGNLYEWGPWVVPMDSLMLLADTRDIIGWPDSRFIGFVSHDQIIARATRTIWGRRLR